MKYRESRPAGCVNHIRELQPLARRLSVWYNDRSIDAVIAPGERNQRIQGRTRLFKYNFVRYAHKFPRISTIRCCFVCCTCADVGASEPRFGRWSVASAWVCREPGGCDLDYRPFFVSRKKWTVAAQRKGSYHG